MIAFAFYFHHQQPFVKVIVHGLIRDQNGKKMSKSQGNGVEQETIISEYGVDSLRLFLLLNNTAGNDISFEPSKLKGCYFFLQKLWSISEFISRNSPEKFQRLVLAGELSSFIKEEKNQLLKVASDHLLSRLLQLEKNYKDQLGDRVETSWIIAGILDFVKEELSNRFIPLLKGVGSNSSYAILNYSFQQLLILLNPSIPFISSYLYLKHTSSELTKLTLDQCLGVHSSHKQFLLLELPSRVRKLVSLICRSTKTSLSALVLELDLLSQWLPHRDLVEEILKQVRKTGAVNITLLDARQGKAMGNRSVELTPFGLLHFSIMEKKQSPVVNSLTSSEFYEREIERSRSLLANKGFVQKAPPELVDSERKKLINYCQQQQKLLKSRGG